MGELSEDDMRETFNLGLGMILAVKPENVDALVGLLEDENESWYKVGQLKNVQTVKKNYFQVRGRIMKIAILASGNGTNFQALAEKFQSGEIPGELSLLFCDHPDAYVVERAKKLNVPYESFTVKECGGKKPYEERLLDLLNANQIDFDLSRIYARNRCRDYQNV